MKKIVSLLLVCLVGLMIVGCSGEKMPEKPNEPGIVDSEGLPTVGSAIANLADYDAWAAPSVVFQTNIVNDGTDITLTLSANDDLILKKFYMWNEATMKWEAYSFDGTEVSGWITSSVTKDIIIPDTLPDENGELFIVGYSCSEQGDDYDCHTNGRWQMTVPRVGGPNVVGVACSLNEDCLHSMYCKSTSCLDEVGACTLLPVTCDPTVDKICGCDGITYDNECLAAQEKISVAHQGKCLPEVPQGYGTNDENCPGKAPETKCVTFSLLTSKGRPISGVEVTYLTDGFQPFGTTDLTGKIHKEVSDGNYRFRTTYQGSSAELGKYQLGNNYFFVDDFNKLIDITTKEFIVELKDSNGNYLEEGNVVYLSSGWKDLGFTDQGYASAELLPASYRVKMTYKGASVEADKSSTGNKYVDSMVNPLITFQTSPVQIIVKDSSGSPIEGALVTFLSTGWWEMGTTDVKGEVDTELLPTNYRIKVTYSGDSMEAEESSVGEKYVPVADYPVIDFVFP